MKKFVIMPVMVLATTIQLNGAASAGAAALRRAGQQLAQQGQRAGMSTSRSSILAPRAAALRAGAARLQPELGSSSQSAAQESQLFNLPASMQQRGMASFWENPFTYIERRTAEERQKAEEQAEQAVIAKRNLVRDIALRIFGLEEQPDHDQGFDKLLERLGTEMGTSKGSKLVVKLMQRDAKHFSTESIASLLSYPQFASQLLITDGGIALLKYLASNNVDVVVANLGSLHRNTMSWIVDKQGPALTDLLIDNPPLARAFDNYITLAVVLAYNYDYYKNPFVADFLMRNPEVAAHIAGSVSNASFNKIQKDPLGKPLLVAILSSPEATEQLANKVGWSKIEDWREINMPEPLALPAVSEEVAERVVLSE
jgi:hypothetical protein